MHGGRAPNAKANGQRRIQQAAAITAVRAFGLPRDIEPHRALREEIARTAGAVDWLTEIVATLDQEAIVMGDQSAEANYSIVIDANGEHSRVPYAGTAGTPAVRTRRGAAPSVWVDLWQKERRHLTDVCTKAIACGLAEREVQIAEREGRAIAEVFRRIEVAVEVGLTPDQREAFRVVCVRELRIVDAEYEMAALTA